MNLLNFIDLMKRDDLQQKDKLFICSNTSWNEYEEILRQRANSAYRVSFLNGVLKIMSPSRNHEIIKDFIYLLIVSYCDAIELDYYPIGSTTLKRKDKSVGKEPDTSFCFNSLKPIPDLAVEVIFSSGSVEDLEKYQQLRVKEVWFWLEDRLEIYVLIDGMYQRQNMSYNLINLDVQLLGKYIAQVLDGNPRKLKQSFIEEIS